jgi:hypothetical protein
VTPRFRLTDLTEWYEKQLANVKSMDDFRNSRFTLDPDEIVPREVRLRYKDLPESVVIRDREVDIEYDVEEGENGLIGVARLRLPEKLARTMNESELPVLDRPLRFVVIRGQRGAIRANTLDELQEALDRPWSPDEVDEGIAPREYESPREKQAREAASRHRQGRGGRRGDRPRGAKRGGDRSRGESGRPGRGKPSKRRFRGR